MSNSAQKAFQRPNIPPVQQNTSAYRSLANAIICGAAVEGLTDKRQTRVDGPPDRATSDNREEFRPPMEYVWDEWNCPEATRETQVHLTQVLEQQSAAVAVRKLYSDGFEHSYVSVGPFKVRPAVGHEVPIGRCYQPVTNSSVSRLAAFVGRDEYSLYIREVPNCPEAGLRPSSYGVWVKQPGQEYFRRLAPGEGERINGDSEIRLGGDGYTAESGFRLCVF